MRCTHIPETAQVIGQPAVETGEVEEGSEIKGWTLTTTYELTCACGAKRRMAASIMSVQGAVGAVVAGDWQGGRVQ